MEENDVQLQIKNITKGLLFLIEHVECESVKNGSEEEILSILNLGEELGIKLGIIVENPTVDPLNGDNLME